MKNPKHEIFIERYALKADRPAREGDNAFVRAGDHIMAGKVILKDDRPVIRTEDGKTVSADNATVLLETAEKQMNSRIAKAIAMKEPQEKRIEWEKRFTEILDAEMFVPAGRILASAGTESPMPYYNGYVIPSPKDNPVDAASVISVIASMMEHGGGVGMNISSIRPKQTGGRGTLEWAELYSSAAALFGRKRGVLMLCIDVWHPEIARILKTRRSFIGNANISVCISDEFMDAVRDGKKWRTVFPDTECDAYATEWNGDIDAWREKGLPVTEAEEFDAAELWNLIMDQIRQYGEPGLIFTGTCRKATGDRIRAANPWLEQCIPEWGVMNLGALNLSMFVKNGNIDIPALEKATETAVRFLDDCIDDTPYPVEANRMRQKAERRIGLGTMGLAQMLMDLDVRYGSKDSLSVIDTVFSAISQAAYAASCRIAEEKGAFDSLSRHDFTATEFVKSLPEGIVGMIGRSGIRNRSLLSQAPTGSTSAYVGTTNGMDPFRDESRFGNKENRQDWHVVGKDITPMEMADVLCAIQRHMDGAIAEVIEVPESYGSRDISELVLHLYSNGCKTVALHKSGSPDIRSLVRSGGVRKSSDGKALEETVADLRQKLNTSRESNAKLARMVNASITRKESGEETLKERCRSEEMNGVTMRRETPNGTAYVTVNCDSEGDIFEVFAQIGKAGSDIAADAEGICRLISLALRMPSPYTPDERAKAVIEQLKGIGSGSRTPGTSRSLADAIASAIESFLERKKRRENECSHS